MNNYKYTYLETKTPEDIYSNQYLAAGIPKGYIVEAFRPPKSGELFLSDVGTVMQRHCTPYTNDPRFILKKSPEIILGSEETTISVKEVYGSDVTIPEGWKFVRFGPPSGGDYYLNSLDPTMREYWDKFMGKLDSPRIIVTKA